jgi:DsbC/DsbD-like thiol-disulfide interchange protein
MQPILRSFAAAVLTATIACGFAQAETSAWSEDAKSAVRLVSGETATVPMHAGVEMKLAPGWHTYWRYPGDSGIPPHFDFSKSENLKAATVLYPAPRLHSDAGGQTIVYEDDVILPLEVTAKDPARPVKLHLSLDYAVCENMCVPAQGTAELTLVPRKTAPDARVKTAFAALPAKETAQAAGLTVKRDGDKAVVAFSATADAPVAVFVEGPTPDWALPIPKAVADSAPGKRAFSFKLEGQPPGASVKGPLDLTFTIVQGARAIEVTTRLD